MINAVIELNMTTELLWGELPPPWTYGVNNDGRIYFINEESHSTTWLHPLRQHPVQTGHFSTTELPPGWEKDYTPEGAPFYIDHNNIRTTFNHPITGDAAAIDVNTLSGSRSPRSPSIIQQINHKKKTPKRVLDRTPSIRFRSGSSPITKQGWLFKQDSTPFKNWKRRWFILSEYCLFYYKDQEGVFGAPQGSVLLPSYNITNCTREEANRPYAFKAEHDNMRTYVLAASSQESCDDWMNVLNNAAALKQYSEPVDEDDGGFSTINSTASGMQFHTPSTPIYQNQPYTDGPQPQYREVPPSDAKSQPWSPSMSESNVMSPLTYPDWTEWSRSQAPEAWDQSLPLAADESYTNPRPYVNAPWYEGTDDKSVQPVQNVVNGDVVPQYPEDHKMPGSDMDTWYDQHDGSGIPTNQRHVQSLDSWQNDSYWDQQRDSITQNRDDGELTNAQEEQQDRPLNRWLKEQPEHKATWNLSEQGDPRSSWAQDQDLAPPSGEDRNNNINKQYYDEQPADKLPERPPLPQQYGGEFREPSVPTIQYSRVTNQFSEPEPYGEPEEPQHNRPELKLNVSSPEYLGPNHYVSDVQDLAGDKTPETRANMLKSLEASIVRHHDTVFQYPETSPPVVNNKSYKSGTQPTNPYPDVRGSAQFTYDGHNGNAQDKSKEEEPIYASPRKNPKSIYNTTPPSQDHNQSYDLKRSYGDLTDSKQALNFYNSSEQFDTIERPDSENPAIVTQARDTMSQFRSSISEIRNSYPGQSHGSSSNHSHDSQSGDLMNRPFEHESQDSILQAVRNNQSGPPLQTYVDHSDDTARTSGPVLRNSYSPPLHPNPVYERQQQLELAARHNTMPGFASQPPLTSHQLSQSGVTSKNPTHSRSQSGESIPRPVNNQNTFQQRGIHSHDQSESGIHSRDQSGASSQSNQPIRRQLPSSPTPGKKQFRRSQLRQDNIDTIKEDPQMDDIDILVTKKLQNLENQLGSRQLRLSINAADLVGKSHEELVLLLIQLRRHQRDTQSSRDFCRAQLNVSKDYEREYQKHLQDSIGQLESVLTLEKGHELYSSMKQHESMLEKQLDVHKPLVNLLDNMVTMGSLYGGNNKMYSSQYRRKSQNPADYTPPKKMLEFSRLHQEERFTKEQEEGLKHLTEEESDLEDKLQTLYDLDVALQELSYAVTSLQEDWAMLEDALKGVVTQSEQETDPQRRERLSQQKVQVQQELSKVRQQLANKSKELEEVSAETAHVENEVVLLRKRVYGGSLRRSMSQPNLESQHSDLEPLRTDIHGKEKAKLSNDLENVEAIRSGLTEQGEKLSEFMSTLRNSMGDLSDKKKNSTYAETDLDTMHTRDLATKQTLYKSSRGSYVPAEMKTKKLQHTKSMGDIPSAMKAELDLPRTDIPPAHANARSRQDLYPSFNKSLTGIVRPHSYHPSNNSSRSSTLERPHSYHAMSQSFDSSARNNTYDMGGALDQPHTHLGGVTERPHPPDMVDGSGDQNGHVDMGDAEDNTKRYYGLIPKEKPRMQTVRDVKKRENERRYRTDKLRQLEDETPPPRPPLPDEMKRATSLPYDMATVGRTYENQPIRQSVGGHVLAGNQSHPLMRSDSNNSITRRQSSNNMPKLRVERSESRRSAADRLFPDGARPASVSSVNSLASSQGSRAYKNNHREELRRHVAPDLKNAAHPLLTADQYVDMSNSPRNSYNSSEDHPLPPTLPAGTALPPHMAAVLPTGTPPPLPNHPPPASDDEYVGPDSAVYNSDYQHRSWDAATALASGYSDDPHASSNTRPTSDPNDFSTSSSLYKSDPDSVRRISDLVTPRPFSISSVSGLSTTSGNSATGPIIKSVNYQPAETAPKSGTTSGVNGPFSPKPSLDISGVFANYAKARKASVDGPLSPNSQYNPSKPGFSKSFPHNSVDDNSISHNQQSSQLTMTVKPLPMAEMKQAHKKPTHTHRYKSLSQSQPSIHQEDDTKQAIKSPDRNQTHSQAGMLFSSLHGSMGDMAHFESKELTFDSETIEREVLYRPTQVEIPERYVSDNSDIEDLSPVQLMQREERSDRYKKIVAAQSLQEWTAQELIMVGDRRPSSSLQDKLLQEKQRREHVLDLRQELAREVTQKSRQVAVSLNAGEPPRISV